MASPVPVAPVAQPVVQAPDYTQGFEKLEVTGTRGVLQYRGRRYYVDILNIEPAALQALKQPDWERIAKDVVAILAKKNVFNDPDHFQGATINAEGVTDSRQPSQVMKHVDPVVTQPEWDDICGRVETIRGQLQPPVPPPPPPQPPNIVVNPAPAPAPVPAPPAHPQPLPPPKPPVAFSSPVAGEPSAVNGFVNVLAEQAGDKIFDLLEPQQIQTMAATLGSTTPRRQKDDLIRDLRAKTPDAQNTSDADLLQQYLEWLVRQQLQKKAIEFQKTRIVDAVKKELAAKKAIDLEALRRGLRISTPDTEANDKLAQLLTDEALRQVVEANKPESGFLKYCAEQVSGGPGRVWNAVVGRT